MSNYSKEQQLVDSKYDFQLFIQVIRCSKKDKHKLILVCECVSVSFFHFVLL